MGLHDSVRLSRKQGMNRGAHGTRYVMYEFLSKLFCSNVFVHGHARVCWCALRWHSWDFGWLKAWSRKAQSE